MTRKIRWGEWVTLTKSVNGVTPYDVKEEANGHIV